VERFGHVPGGAEAAEIIMPLAFLNPWLWIGALALAAPLWLHLRRRQETNVLRFSALRFLDDEPQPRQSPLRLRNILLFLLRALALLLWVPGFIWIAEKLYNLVARNRRTLSRIFGCKEACSILPARKREQDEVR